MQAISTDIDQPAGRRDESIGAVPRRFVDSSGSDGCRDEKDRSADDAESCPLDASAMLLRGSSII